MPDIQPLVSIITPTYNRAEFIGTAIESVLAQTYGHFELLIVDDGSTDNTTEVLEPYLKDKRVRVFRQENQGQSVARNVALAQAKGEFICFLDSDNAWVPEKLEHTLQVFDTVPECDVVYGDYVVIDANGKELGINRAKRYSGSIAPQLVCDNFVSMNTTMTRKQCFQEMGGFDTNERLAEDYVLWLRFSTRYRFYYLAEVLGYYRVMTNQLSTDKEAQFRANERQIHHFLKAFPQALSMVQKYRGLSRFYIRKGYYELSAGRYCRATRELFRGLSMDPFWRGPWRLIAKLMLQRLRRGGA